MATKLKSSATFDVQLLVVFVIITILQETYSINKLGITPQQKNFIVMTSIRCVALDEIYASVDKCIVKPINRTQKYFIAHAVTHKVWRKPIDMRFRVMKRTSGGYKPFAIDVTFEGCQYLAGKRNRAVDWFYEMTFKHSNVNHSCPYTGEISFEVPVTQMQYPSVFPGGDYRFDTEFGIDGKVRIIVNVFVSLKEL